jgi:hypothetical protein
MRNRKLNHKRIKAYAKDISNGHWTMSPSPISFSVDGTLIDGQHRLNAVLAANVPVNMMIAYDVPAESVIDRGLPRDSGSALYIRGLIDEAVSNRCYMAVVNRYLAVVNGGAEIQDYERAAFINENQDNLIAAVEISRTGSHNPLCRRAPVQAAIMAALINGVPEETLISFANVVNTGFMSDSTQASAIVLRNYILENSLSGHSASDAMAACAQMAIRDFVNKSTRRVKYRRKYHVYINGKETVRKKQ